MSQKKKNRECRHLCCTNKKLSYYSIELHNVRHEAAWIGLYTDSENPADHNHSTGPYGNWYWADGTPYTPYTH